MDSTTRSRVLATVQSNDTQLLEELRSVLSGAGEMVGKVAEQPSVVDLRFDPQAACQTVLGVLAAINTVGGAIKFIAWVRDQMRKTKETPQAPNVVIRIGEETLVLSKEGEFVEVERKLKELLKVEDNLS